MATKKHIVYLDSALERAEIMPVPDFEEKLALLKLLESTDEPAFKRTIQRGLNNWWLEDCETNAKTMADFLHRHHRHTLGTTAKGTRVQSLTLYADEPFELIAGQIESQVGDETSEWPIQGYGYPGFHLCWFPNGEMVLVNQTVKWDEEGWIFYGDLQLCFRDLNLSPHVTTRFIFTAESLFSPGNEKVEMWADGWVLAEGTKSAGEYWHTNGISISGTSITDEELKKRLGLTISKRRINKRHLLTNKTSISNQVCFVVSKLDYLLEDAKEPGDRWQKIYSASQEASARIRRFS